MGKRSWLILPLRQTLKHGLLLGLVFCAAVTAVIWLDPRFFMDDYTPNIQAAAGPDVGFPSGPTLVLGVALIFVPLMGGLVGSLAVATRQAPERANLWSSFLHCFLVAQVGNMLDVVLMDWLLFVWWTPAFMVVPGTLGAPGYDNYWFYFEASYLKPGPYVVLGLLSMICALAMRGWARIRSS
ncbi:MAG TPA: hypothetical protein DD979_18495 [Gammaproteobacteria bacterium]|jgi:hypothetical protein|nr:hypothetical protein [Gammaproteobacteria bacterium]